MFPHTILQVSLDVPDLWKTIVIVLFILSMINERITNFIKLNIESVLTRLLGLDRYERLFKGKTNFKLVEDDPLLEKNRERGIINVAVMSGFVVATICGADLIFLVQTGALLRVPDLTKFWDLRAILGTLGRHGLGFLLTAFFISLGSKFWHDLLDVLLYTSNLKRKLTNEPELFRSGSAAEVVELAELTPAQLAQVALNQHEASLRQHPDVIDVVAGLRQVDGLARDAVTVYLRDNVPNGFPRTLSVTLASGRKVPLPVVYVTDYGTCPQAHLKVGDPMKPNGSLAQGTLCCLLNGVDPQDGQRSAYALTCSHVLTNREYVAIGGFVPDVLVKDVSIGLAITGKWRYSLLTRTMDIALVRIKAGLDAAFVPTLNLKTTHRTLTRADIGAKLRLTILTSRGVRQGCLTALHTGELQIEYAGNKKEGMAGLIELAKVAGQAGAPTTDGDSGALVVDDQNRLVGMIVAGNNRTHSYAIPMPAIIQTLAEEIPALTLQI